MYVGLLIVDESVRDVALDGCRTRRVRRTNETGCGFGVRLRFAPHSVSGRDSRDQERLRSAAPRCGGELGRREGHLALLETWVPSGKASEDGPAPEGPR